MSRIQTAIVAANALMLFATIVALGVRWRFKGCRMFAVYLAGVLVGNVTLLVAVRVVLSPRIWLIAELTFSFLGVLMAAELAVYTFSAFPVARVRARQFLWLMVAAALTSAFWTPSDLASYGGLMGRVLPRVLMWVGVWLFTGLGAVVLWYRIPLDRLRKAILMGLVPYLLVFTALTSLLDTLGWGHRVWASYAQTGAYFVVVAFWAYVAWSPEPAATQPPGTADRL